MTKTKRKRTLSIIHPHRHVKEETAFQWLQRVQTYKRLAFQNPIHFPYLCIHSNINATTNTNTTNTNTNNTFTSTSLLLGTKDYNHDNEYSTIICTNNDDSITNRFHVTNENIIRMNSKCFFLRMNELNELRMKSKQWQRRQRKIRILSSKKGRKQQQQQQRMDGNTSNHCTNKNRNDLSHDDNYYYKFEKLEKELLDSCFVKGTGITFIDQLILQYQKKQHKQQQHKQQQQIQHPSKNIQHSYKDYKNQNNKSNVIEILGRSSTGKSQILMSLAANYVASTTCNFIPSNIITNNNFIMESSSSSTSSTMSPIVIIIDPEHSIHVHQLKNYIVSALLRRWNATDSFRHNYQSIAMSSSSTTTTAIPHDQNNNTPSSPSSMHLLDQQVLDALDRIHIIRPTDVSNGYVATLECLYQSLHELYHTSSSSSSSLSSPPPIMLLMDSVVSAFDATDKMYESMGVGLSGRHEFIRQLKRLQQSFDIELIATRTIRGGVGGGGGASNTNTVSSSISNHGYSNYNYNSSLDGWNKMITSRITLEKALSGSQEMNNGFPFVAITSLHHEKSENSTDIMQWSNVIPFRVSDTDGIKCQSSIIVGT